MAMTNVVMIPTSKKHSVSPFVNVQETSTQLVNFGKHAHRRVSELDELMVLDFGTLIQFNKVKATYLFENLTATPLAELNDDTHTISQTNEVESVVDCCVVDTSMDEIIEVVYFPSTLKTVQSKKRRKRKKTTVDRKSTRLNSSHLDLSRMPSSA